MTPYGLMKSNRRLGETCLRIYRVVKTALNLEKANFSETSVTVNRLYHSIQQGDL